MGDRVLSYAKEEAERLRADQIGTEHLLLGLLHEEGGIAYRALSDLNISIGRLNLLLIQARPPERVSTRQFELSFDAKKVLEIAVYEARALGHHYIGTEHLLLGLVKAPDNTILNLLQHLNVNPDTVYKHTLAVIRTEWRTKAPDRHVTVIEFSPTTQQVIQQVAVEARKWGTTTVQPVHIMLALLDQNDGTIDYVLKHFNITSDDLRRQIAETLQKRLPPSDDPSPPPSEPQS